MKNKRINRVISIVMTLILLISTSSLLTINSFAKTTESITSKIVNINNDSLNLIKLPNDFYLENIIREDDYTISEPYVTRDDENYISLSEEDITIKNVPANLSVSYTNPERCHIIDGVLYFDVCYITNDDVSTHYWAYTENYVDYYFAYSIPEKEYLLPNSTYDYDYDYVTNIDGKYIYTNWDQLCWTSDFENFNTITIPNMECNVDVFGESKEPLQYSENLIHCIPIDNGFIVYVTFYTIIGDCYWTYLNLPNLYYTEDFVSFFKIESSELDSFNASPNQNTSLYFSVSEHSGSACLIVTEHNVKVEYETYNNSTSTYVSNIEDLSTIGSVYQFDSSTLSFQKWYEANKDFGYIYQGKDHAVLNSNNQNYIELNGDNVTEYNVEALNAKTGYNGTAYVCIFDTPNYYFGFTDCSIWYTEDFKTIYNFKIPLSGNEKIDSISYTALGNCVFEMSDQNKYILKISEIKKAIDEYKATGYQGFPDVHEGDWFYDAVQYCAQKGFITGYKNGNFGPADALQRQDFVVILARIAGADIDGYTSCKLKDVDMNAYYGKAVAWAVDQKIIGGYDNGKFGVGDKITREQVATILYRYMDSPDVDTSILNKFADKGSISAFALNAIAWANANGVINGKTATTLAPTATASRAEIATIIMRMDQQGMFA